MTEVGAKGAGRACNFAGDASAVMSKIEAALPWQGAEKKILAALDGCGGFAPCIKGPSAAYRQPTALGFANSPDNWRGYESFPAWKKNSLVKDQMARWNRLSCDTPDPLPISA